MYEFSGYILSRHYIHRYQLDQICKEAFDYKYISVSEAVLSLFCKRVNTLTLRLRFGKNCSIVWTYSTPWFGSELMLCTIPLWRSSQLGCTAINGASRGKKVLKFPSVKSITCEVWFVGHSNLANGPEPFAVQLQSLGKRIFLSSILNKMASAVLILQCTMEQTACYCWGFTFSFRKTRSKHAFPFWSRSTS